MRGAVDSCCARQPPSPAVISLMWRAEGSITIRTICSPAVPTCCEAPFQVLKCYLLVCVVEEKVTILPHQHRCDGRGRGRGREVVVLRPRLPEALGNRRRPAGSHDPLLSPYARGAAVIPNVYTYISPKQPSRVQSQQAIWGG